MTRFWNQISIWSLLYELVLIYGSSHGSVFESPGYRVHSEHNSESPVTEFRSHERVRIAVLCNRTHITYTNTHLYVHIHILMPKHAYVYKYIYIHTYYILTYLTHTCTRAPSTHNTLKHYVIKTHTCICIYIYPHTPTHNNYTYLHKYLHLI